MKIKAKLNLGVGLLFLLIVLLALLGARQINTLANDTENILEANYNTLDYSRQMLSALDALEKDPSSAEVFRINLDRQIRNITEPGEKESTGKLKAHFEQLLADPGNPALPRMVRADLNETMRLNMMAIQRKSLKAENTADRATLWIVITGTLCFLIAFILLVNLPGNIADPIRELTGSIKNIAAKNYSQRVHFQDHNEFGELARAFNTMAEKLEEYHNSNLSKILFEKKRIDTLISSMPNPVIGLDEQRKIIFANDEALRVTGLKRDELIGRTAQDVALHNDLVRNLVRDLVHGPAPEKENAPLKIYTGNKESYFEKSVINISITPTGETQAKDIGDVIILQNITPFKELDFARTNFIATVSHELKTPIAAILMSLKLLEDKRVGGINTEQAGLIRNIREDSERLLKITGELLNLAQVETGNIQLSLRPSAPEEILRYAVEATQVQALHNSIRVEVIHSGELPAIYADSEKTAWVLTNLVSNAIRYSPANSSVVLSVFQQGQQLVFSVKDQGPGIADEYRQRIFERYFQVPGTGRTGTGLGLAISKEFIEAQGGTIAVESEPGAGSTFTFRLNLA